jgi:hypothetical protein
MKLLKALIDYQKSLETSSLEDLASQADPKLLKNFLSFWRKRTLKITLTISLDQKGNMPQSMRHHLFSNSVRERGL